MQYINTLKKTKQTCDIIHTAAECLFAAVRAVCRCKGSMPPRVYLRLHATKAQFAQYMYRCLEGVLEIAQGRQLIECIH